MRVITTLFLLIILVSGVVSCNDGQSGASADTNFGRMLAYVPADMFQERDVFFADYGKARELHNSPELAYLEAIQDLPDDQKELVLAAMDETDALIPPWSNYPLYETTGFDLAAIDQYLSVGVLSPRLSSLLGGDYDTNPIQEKLTGLGYNTATYESHDYLSIRGDFEQSISDPLSRMVFAAMNRVVVQDTIIMLSPATADIQGFLDAGDDRVASVIDTPEYLALIDSLGDVLIGTLTTPERMVNGMTNAEGAMMFSLPAARNWDKLNGYEAAALGYRADGEQRYLDIALFYGDATDATADGDLIIERMNDYYLNSFADPDKQTPFTDHYQPGEPSIREYDNGVVLLISCHIVPQEHLGVSGSIIGGYGFGFRDLLFLAPDPEPYLE